MRIYELKALNISPESCLAKDQSGGLEPATGVAIAVLSQDYEPAQWVQAANFSWGPTKKTHVVIHTVQGSYQSCINWFLNPDSQVSAHYVISNSGEVTQMVQEGDIAWHVGTENGYAIGIEHEGYIDDGSPPPEAMLRSSAALTADICRRHSIPVDRSRIRGHVEMPNQNHTDPGREWPWDLYMQYVREAAGGAPGGGTLSALEYPHVNIAADSDGDLTAAQALALALQRQGIRSLVVSGNNIAGIGDEVLASQPAKKKQLAVIGGWAKNRLSETAKNTVDWDPESNDLLDCAGVSWEDTLGKIDRFRDYLERDPGRNLNRERLDREYYIALHELGKAPAR